MSESTFLARLVHGRGAGRSLSALHFLSDREPKVIRQSLDRQAVAAAASASAAVLASAGVREGDAVVIALGTGPAFVGWLLGAMWIGAVPVPVPSPTAASREAGVDRFETVITHSAPRAIVGDEHALSLARSAGTTAALLAASAPSRHGAVPLAAESEERPAFIQYTAGSTGAPKGVVVTLKNLRGNLEAIGKAVRVSSEDRIVSWLPLYHDMGLVGALLFSLYWDVPLYLMSPVGFVLRPVGWLEAISAHRGTLSPAPHFAYSLCAYKLRDEALGALDLSSWRLALDGAEPIRARNARSFIERFQPRGFRPEAYAPVYGLSEATLAVTFPDLGEGVRVDRVSRDALARGVAEPAPPGAPGSARDVVELVAVGRPLEGMRVEIRSASGEAAPERTLGEICVSGSSVSPRYLGRGGPARSVLHTGDIGYLADGVLYVTERLKDIIIQGGSNVYPSDLEAAAAEVSGVRSGRVVAFGVADAEEGTEDVVIAAEVRSGADRGALRGAIRAAVQRRSGVVVGDVVLLDPGTLPLTTSGKLMRSRVRESYAAGSLEKRGVAKWVARIRRRVAKAAMKRSR
jgi:acyl-CoA synthetase (AMP-forming)/AMP-acid ligase II